MQWRISDFTKGGSSIKNAFEATPTFALTTPIQDQKWRVLSGLLGSRASSRPEFVQNTCK